MKYHELQAAKHKAAHRVGRGIAAGQGKTAGRGTKGQKARTGSKKRPGFEGGQTPLMQHLPKLGGFTSKRPQVELVRTGDLDQFSGKTVTTATLAEAGLLTSPYVVAKLLLKGEVTKKVTIKLPAASAGAIAAVQKTGGSFEEVAQLGRPAATPDKKVRTRKKR
ncbi:MAG TPA: 50S ribosomal protein L15 [Candidatus Saccharimonadales bacterium]|nr:50S ribosomal protein L15 [Candidatus Saccharimonadales bacterium]